MARDEETVASYTSVRIIAEGSLGKDPRNISRSDNAMVVFPIYCKNRDRNGEIGTLWYQVTVFGKAGENALRDFKKNDRIIVQGSASERTFEGTEGEVSQTAIIADMIGPSSRYATVEIENNWEERSGGGDDRGRSRGRSRDEDNAEEDNEEDAPRRTRGARSSNRRPRGGSSREETQETQEEAPSEDEGRGSRRARRQSRNVQSHGDDDNFGD